jgi:hypothetical protein
MCHELHRRTHRGITNAVTLVTAPPLPFMHVSVAPPLAMALAGEPDAVLLMQYYGKCLQQCPWPMVAAQMCLGRLLS